jgi:hypothetical protein
VIGRTAGRIARTELRVALRDGRVRWMLGVLLALLVATGAEGWRRSVEIRMERAWAQQLVREMAHSSSDASTGASRCALPITRTSRASRSWTTRVLRGVPRSGAGCSRSSAR